MPERRSAPETVRIEPETAVRIFSETRVRFRRNPQNGSLALHEASAQTYLMVVRSFFNWAVTVERIVRENPVKGLNLGKVLHAPRRRFCSFAQRDEIIRDAPNDDLRFVFYCGFHAGLRKNEIVQAKPEWFDLGPGLLHVCQTPTFVPKDKEDRTIPLTAEFQEFLKRYGLRSPFMLKPEVTQGKSVYRYDFDRPYFAYLTPKGYRWVTAHVMRHTFASLLATKDRSIYKIAAWLGDEVKTAQRHYAHLLPVDREIEADGPAAERMEMDWEI